MAKGSVLQAIDRFVTNRQMRFLLRLGIAPRAFALVETTGCQSGRLRQTPVGNGLEVATFWLVAMDGTRCNYVQNLAADPRVRVKVRKTWYTGTATLLPADDAIARRRRLDAANGLIGRLDGIIFRRLARDPLTVRIDLSS